MAKQELNQDQNQGEGKIPGDVPEKIMGFIGIEFLDETLKMGGRIRFPGFEAEDAKKSDSPENQSGKSDKK
jgi:hypothetical protein